MRTITPMLIVGEFAMTEDDRLKLELARDILRAKLETEGKGKNGTLTPEEIATYVVEQTNLLWAMLFPTT